MMIKGVHKNVVFIQDLENEVFEQAIFILKPSQELRGHPTQENILQQAQQVLSDYAASPKGMEITLPRRKKGRRERRLIKGTWMAKTKNSIYAITAFGVMCVIIACVVLVI